MSEGTQTTHERTITVLEDGPTGPFNGGQQGDPGQRTVGGYIAGGETGGDSETLEDMSVKDLKAEAKSLGLSGLSDAKKGELVSAIRAEYDRQDAEGDDPSDPDDDDGS